MYKGIVKGCRLSDCELVGGETAEMPGTYSKGKFDIAGFAVGIVGKNKIRDLFCMKKLLKLFNKLTDGVISKGWIRL